MSTRISTRAIILGKHACPPANGAPSNGEMSPPRVLFAWGQNVRCRECSLGSFGTAHHLERRCSTVLTEAAGCRDQRICLVPDGDFFTAVREGKAKVVTGHIDTVTETGITMKGGERVDVDIIITATGLTLQPNFPMSTMEVTIDGKPYVAADTLIYKGCMISDVPNMTFTIGYANASWTLKADIVSKRVCRLLQRMRKGGDGMCVPRPTDVEIDDTNVLGLSSGYLLRAQASMPKVGKEFPWDAEQNYLLDLWRTWPWETFDDGYLIFSPSRVPPLARL
eukprot:m.68448 g.68448  ORF g.68448 m.68448 type:complete len:280 (-) comp18314_c0_seq5:210-1049(-)